MFFLLLIPAALLLLYALFCFVFRTPRRHPETPHAIPDSEQYRAGREHMTRMIDGLLAAPFERVTVQSHDGLTLSARYYHTRDGAPLEIEFHGYRGSAIRDFCGGNPMSCAAGRNVLLVDQRGHGESGGRTITFGVLERLDCLTWVNYAVGRFGPDVKILLSGISMGGATVLMASELDLPANVRAIFADCPFSSPRAIICKVGRGMRLPMGMLYPLVRLSARLFGGFDPDSAGAVDAVRRAKVPVFLIHGEDDRFVPCDMSREIAAACASPVRIVTVPRAGHGLSFILDEAVYRSLAEEACRELEK